MSGFDPDWLALRERADENARAAATERLVTSIAPRDSALRVVDLGAGSGNNAAHLAPRIAARLHTPQSWCLVDGDAGLLERAAARATGIDSIADVQTRLTDLAAGLGEAPLDAADLVTASALFDLASAAWIERFADAVADAHVPAILAALTIDGRVEWTPGDSFDARASELFHADMRRDKGLGVALAGAATDALTAALSRRGYACERVDSAWQLGADDAGLQRRYLDDVTDTIAAKDDGAQSWRERRRARIEDGTSRLVVGHSDVLAWREA
ncbi:MAG: class I SAM-dependent methyltransferase [Planctomycetota bacterium]